MDNTQLIAQMQEGIEQAREALDDFRRAQNGDSDESNPDTIQQLTASLDNAEGEINDLVP